MYPTQSLIRAERFTSPATHLWNIGDVFSHPPERTDSPPSLEEELLGNGFAGELLALDGRSIHSFAAERASSTTVLSDWLRATTMLTLWLPTLDVNATLSAPRLQFLFIAGNQAKHNVARLTAVAKSIATMLEQQHGHEVALEQIPLALDDFREHLHSDYFTYYGGWLAELLNEVRWGIYHYLRPTFQQSFTPDLNGGIRYTYRYPESIASETPQQWFCRLMNLCRSEPWVHPFTVAEHFKREVLR